MFVQADGCACGQREPADFADGILVVGLVAGIGKFAEQFAFAACGFAAVPCLHFGFFIHLHAAIYGRFAGLIGGGWGDVVIVRMGGGAGASLGAGFGAYSRTPEGKTLVNAFLDSMNQLVIALKDYKAQTVKGGLGKGGSLKVGD